MVSHFGSVSGFFDDFPKPHLGVGDLVLQQVVNQRCKTQPPATAKPGCDTLANERVLQARLPDARACQAAALRTTSFSPYEAA